MTKTLSPLLSFEAEGSIGKEITYAKTITGTIAKTIPTHKDSRTLPQIYQRWLYTDAWWAWHALTKTQQNTWHTNARPYRLTGWQYFVKKYLILPTDLVLWLKLDEPTGSTAHDSSKHGKNATIYGASPVVGYIDLCRSFDGIDDNLQFATNSLNFNIMTITLRLKTSQGNKYPFTNYYRLSTVTPEYGWYIFINYVGRPSIILNGEGYNSPSGPAVNDNTWHQIAFTINNTDVNYFTDKQRIWQKTFTAPSTFTATMTPWLAKYRESNNNNFMACFIDEVRIYTRILSDNHIFNIYDRHYPS